ncbi:type VI secretion system Vgr family protein [[Pseudomonas] boreopolis]
MEALRTWLTQSARLTDASRLHRLELAGLPAQVVERWYGREEVSRGYDYWVDVLSADAGLALEGWLGQRATLYTRDARGGQVARSGLVNEATLLDSEGGLARYRVRLVGWTWWLSQGRHSRVFQDRSVVEIVEAVFAGYAPQASWRWSEEVAGFLSEARPRRYCVQYRESDLAFVARLLAEEGLGWRWETDGEAASGHRLVIFAASGEQPQEAASAAQGGVRFHRGDATEASDSVLALGRRRTLGSSQLTVLSHDYRSSRALSAQLPLAGGDATPRELYEPAGQYAYASSAEAERYARLMAQAQEASWSAWEGRGTVRSFTAGQWFAVSQWPGGAAQLWLSRIEHVGVNNLPTDAREALEQALPPATPPLAVPAEVEALAARVGYAHRFQAVERDRPWRPVLEDETGARTNPRPTAPGYQSAIVVGPDGATTPNGAQEVYADAQGRIRVKLHFQQGQAADDRDTAWLRVSQRYAGPGVGSQFLPRIGQEVLVGFLEGDIDRPVVLGALYNGRGEAGVAATPGGRSEAAGQDPASLYAQATDARASAQANLAGGHAPAWHAAGGGEQAHRHAGALWGVQSKEWGGSGHNRLLFDDSDGQLRLQLSSSQYASQLNLGHLIHQADNYRGSFRGEGFELRTDAWGAVRAERGLWLSAYGHDGTRPAGTAAQPAALLKQLQTLGKTFTQAAGTHQTARLAAAEGVKQAGVSQLVPDQAPLQATLTSVSTTVPGTAYGEAEGAAHERSASPGADRVPHTGDPLLGLAAPAGIGLVAGQALHWSAGETLTLASGRGSEVAVAGDARLHAGQAIGVLAAAVEGGNTQGHTLSVVSGEGELELQAQNDEVRLQARQGLKVVSANAAVELAAGKRVRLATAGGASVTIEGGNISIACPGKITVHAAKKSFLGATHLSREMNEWPQAKFDDPYILRHRATNEPLRNMRVELTRADGARLQLVTDGEGRLPVQKGLGPEDIAIKIIGKA